MNKKVFISGILFLMFNNYAHSQSGWFQQWSGVSVSLNSTFFVNSNTGWICGDSGKILKTSNGGNNWIQQNSPTQYPLLSVFFLNENTGWCSGGVADFNVFPNRMIVLKTVNGGNTWTVSYFSNSSYSCFSSIYFIDALHGSVVEQGGTGSGTVGGSWISSDGGYNWLPTLAYATSDIQFTDANTGWVIGNFGDDTGHDTSYISKSVNGGNTWNKVYQKSKTTLYSLHFINNNYGWVAGNDHENFINDNIILKTTNAGANWEKHILGQNVFLEQIFFSDFNNGWGCSGRIYRTTNSGLNWELQLDYIGNFYNSIFFTDSLRGWVTGTNGIILKTITGGITSIGYSNENIPDNFSLSQNYPNPFNPTTNIHFSIPENSYVFLKVYDVLGKEIGVLVNENLTAGSYNFDFNAANLTSGVYFYHIVIHSDKLITENFSDIKKMTLLQEWSSQILGINSILTSVTFSNENKGFVTSIDGKVLYTSDGGTNWSIQYSENNNFSVVQFLNENTGYIAAYGNYILKTTTGGLLTGISNAQYELVKEFYLLQNYPNPFNPTTNINFSIPKNSYVSLKVYDVLGKEVAALVNENLTAGSYNFDFNAANLTSGVYFYKLTTENFSDIKKMTLLK